MRSPDSVRRSVHRSRGTVPAETIRRLRRFAGRVALLAVALAATACVGSDDATEPQIPGDSSPSGAVTGLVVDEELRPVGAAEVRVASDSADVERTTHVNEVGQYTVADLRGGTYDVSVLPPDRYEPADGHRSTYRVEVRVEEVTRIDFHLELEEGSEE